MFNGNYTEDKAKKETICGIVDPQDWVPEDEEFINDKQDWKLEDILEQLYSN